MFTSFQLLADGLSDLKAALGSLQGNSPISATVESSFTQKRGKPKKLKTNTGLIQVDLTDDHHGLQLTFNDAVITKLEDESKQKELDEEANTPTLNAVDNVGVAEMKRMLSAAPSLLRFINKATFINEETINYQQQQLRQLNFQLPLEAIIENKDIHEYVDEFTGSYQVIINSNGIPLETKLEFQGSGSAYIFFTMELSQSNQNNFKLIDDRLVNVKKIYQFNRSSTWGKTHSNGYTILVVNPNKFTVAATN